MLFQWDEKNISHVEEHGVSPHEAEFVIRHAMLPFPERVPDGKWLVWGTTDAGDYLQVIFVLLTDDRVVVQNMVPADLASFMDGEEVVYVAHAMPMTDKQKSQFRNRNKKKGHR
jgi:uncharacterized DUF497 family protein